MALSIVVEDATAIEENPNRTNLFGDATLQENLETRLIGCRCHQNLLLMIMKHDNLVANSMLSCHVLTSAYAIAVIIPLVTVIVCVAVVSIDPLTPLPAPSEGLVPAV